MGNIGIPRCARNDYLLGESNVGAAVGARPRGVAAVAHVSKERERGAPGVFHVELERIPHFVSE